MTDPHAIDTAIAALEAQRALLGDAAVDAGLAVLREKLGATTQQLRHVTVLFLDVVGSTELSHRLDPEDMHAVLDGLLMRATATVQAFQGKVLQYAGDSLLAVFGAEQSAEDDAERAVRAGLALLELGREQGERVRQRFGQSGFDVRVGVHSGGVLLGGGVDEVGSIRGAVVHIAARMEQSAPPGGLRISHDTYRHVRGVFDVEVQAPLELKGLAEPAVTYLVRRAKPRAFRPPTRGVEGLETRLVGRDAELGRLQSAFESVSRDGGFSAVTLIGEAGLGKSRLLHEFENWAEARPAPYVIFRGRAQPSTQAQAYGLLRDVFAWRFLIADSDDLASAQHKLETGIAPLFEAEFGADMAIGNAHVLGHLIGLDMRASRHVAGIVDDGAQLRARGFHVAAQVLRRMAQREAAPVLLLLDDLHWADAASLLFLEQLAELNRDVPTLLVAAARPALYERNAHWAPAPAQHTRSALESLDELRSLELAHELLQRLDETPQALRELLTAGAAGNPYYMEELLKMLIDEGAIVVHEEAWSVRPERLRATRVPLTLTGVLQARLDSLAGPQRKSLQQAALIGTVFWDAALAALEADAPLSLPHLQHLAMIVPHAASTIDEAAEFGFKHQLLHQVTYDTMLKQARRDGHAKVAAWLVGLSHRGGQRANPLHALIAEHFEKSGDAHNACEYYTRCAEHAATRYAHDVLLEASDKALALAGADDAATRWRLHTVRERYFDTQGQRDLQQAALDELHTLAEATADDARRAEVAWRRADLAFRTGDFPTSELQARRGLELAQVPAAQVQVLRCQHMLAIALYSQRELDAAKAMARDGLAQARACADLKMEARFLNALAVTTQGEDDLMGGYKYDLDVLRLCREIGNRRDEAVALSNLGNMMIGLGDSTQARGYLEQGLHIARAVGARFVEPHVLHHLAELELQLGNPAAARECAQAALALSQAMHDRVSEAVCALSLGEAELALRNLPAAQSGYERALALCVELKSPIQLDAKAGLARLALARGAPHQAASVVEELFAHFGEQRNFDGTVSAQLVHMTCVRVLGCLADPRAAAVLRDAYSEMQAQAARISDAALRGTFLANIPVNREIESAWRQLPQLDT